MTYPKHDLSPVDWLERVKKELTAYPRGLQTCNDNALQMVELAIGSLLARPEVAHAIPAGTPEGVFEWILHMDLHLTEHDLPHAGMALRAAWPHVRAHFMGLQDTIAELSKARTPQSQQQEKKT